MSNVDTTNTPIPLSARIRVIPESIPISEKSNVPTTRKALHPSFLSDTSSGTSAVGHTSDVSRSVLPKNMNSERISGIFPEVSLHIENPGSRNSSIMPSPTG